jgi:DNA adenine methylase
MNKPPTRPALRYYGGKWKIADWIISHFPRHRCYTEGFGGAASVLLRKPPSRVEVYNDMSDEIVNLFRVLRNTEQAAELRRLLDLTPWSRSEWLASYELCADQVEQARRTIVLASMSHNPSKALCRRSNGWRSASSGHHMLPKDFQTYTQCLPEITARLKTVLIEHRGYASVLSQHDSSETLHYVDPPYLGELRADPRNTYQHELWSIEDHQKLAEFLHTLEGYVIISGYPSKEYEDLYEARGWSTSSTMATTGAAVTGKSSRIEMIWLNPRAAAAQKQYSLF